MAARCSFTIRSLSRSLRSSGHDRVGLGHSFSITGLAQPAKFSTSSSSSSSQALAAEKSTPHSPAPPPPSTPTTSATSPSDPKISRIVDDISALTLLQAADLVSLLKSRLNIQEIAMPAVAAPAPASSAAAEEAPVEEKPKEKTIFNVTLDSFDAGSKPKVIREVKALIPNLTLIDAKKFVESVPKVLKENLPKEEAEKLKATFLAIGAVIKLD